MSARSKTERAPRTPRPGTPPVEPQEEHEPLEVEGGEPRDGESEEISQTPEALQAEEPAQVELKIKGSDRSARAAAKRFGGDTARPAPLPVTTPADDPETPNDDPIATLLADGKNMVIVTRQTPRKVSTDFSAA